MLTAPSIGPIGSSAVKAKYVWARKTIAVSPNNQRWRVRTLLTLAAALVASYLTPFRHR